MSFCVASGILVQCIAIVNAELERGLVERTILHTRLLDS